MYKNEIETRIETTFAHLIGETIRKNGIRRLIFSVGKDLVGAWSAGSPIRNKLARPIDLILTKTLGRNGTRRSAAISSELGKLATLWAQKVNALHQEDTAAHVAARAVAIKAFIENTDFGELAEMVTHSEECAVGTAIALNEELWKYPAKIANLLLALIGVANTSLRITTETLRPIEENLSPDLLADMILSVMKSIRPRDMGALLSASLEFLRKLHTGDLLLGKAGKTLFQTYLTDIITEVSAQIDPQLLQKARMALAEDKVAIAGALSQVLTENPGFVLSGIVSKGSIRTSQAKAASRRIRVLEEIDGNDLRQALSESMSNLDTYEIAELVNSACRALGRIREAKPDIVSNLLSSVVDSVNPEEIRSIAQWLIPDVVDAFRPLLPEVMPILVKSVQGIAGGDAPYDQGGLRASGGEQ